MDGTISNHKEKMILQEQSNLNPTTIKELRKKKEKKNSSSRSLFFPEPLKLL